MSNVPLPNRSCIVTYMGNGKGLHYSLGVSEGTRLIEQPPGSQLDLYTADQMHSHAAAVSAAKDAEIAQLRADLIKSLADNKALRADAIDRQNNVVAPLRAEVAVLKAENAHARDCLNSAITLLTGIHSLMYPPEITTADGRVMVFRPKSIDPHEILQGLSDRIRALPDELAALAARKGTTPTRLPPSLSPRS